MPRFTHPESVGQCAARTGLFSASDFLYDKNGFVQQALVNWGNFPGNTVPLPPERFETFAESLHELYVAYREWVDTHKDGQEMSRVVSVLASRSVEEAWRKLADLKSGYMAAKCDATQAKASPERLSLGEEIDRLKACREPLIAEIQAIEQEQDKLAMKGRVTDAQNHRAQALKEAQSELFDVNLRLKELTVQAQAA